MTGTGKLDRVGRFHIREQSAAGPHDVGQWIVTDDVGHVCTAELTGREYVSTPNGTRPLDRQWLRDEVVRGVAHAVEAALVTPPEKKPGETFPVNVTSYDLYEANRKL